MILYSIKLFNSNYIKHLKLKDFVIESLYTDGFVYEDIAVAMQTGIVTDVYTHSISKKKYLDRYTHITSELLEELASEHVIAFLDGNYYMSNGNPIHIPNHIFLKGKGRILYESRELYFPSFEKNVQLRIDILRNWFLVLLALATLIFGVIQYRSSDKKQQSIEELQTQIIQMVIHIDSIKKNSDKFDLKISSQIKEVKDSLSIISNLKFPIKQIRAHDSSKKKTTTEQDHKSNTNPK